MTDTEAGTTPHQPELPTITPAADVFEQQLGAFGRWFDTLTTPQKQRVRMRSQLVTDAAKLEARSVIEFLNARRRELQPRARGFDAGSPRVLAEAAARIAAGEATAGELRAIVRVKAEAVREGRYKFEHLRPRTLFNATLVQQYLAELGT